MAQVEALSLKGEGVGGGDVFLRARHPYDPIRMSLKFAWRFVCLWIEVPYRW